MKKSEQTNEISAALAKAQGIMNNPERTANNPHFRSKYADLGTGISAIRAGLSANGIAYIQATRIDGDVLVLDTRLTHSSDQWFECEWPVCKLPAQPQMIGSALTYARRYSLFTMVGIAGEDDDGNAANAQQTPAPPISFISEEQAEILTERLKAAKRTPERFLEFFSKSKNREMRTVPDIPTYFFDEAMDIVNDLIAKLAAKKTEQMGDGK